MSLLYFQSCYLFHLWLVHLYHFGDYMRNHPEEPVKLVALTETTSSSLIPVRKGEQNLLEAINQALEEMRQSGELKAISEKYFGMDVTSNEVR